MKNIDRTTVGQIPMFMANSGPVPAVTQLSTKLVKAEASSTVLSVGSLVGSISIADRNNFSGAIFCELSTCMQKESDDSTSDRKHNLSSAPPVFLIDPALRSTSSAMTLNLAISQTEAARNLLYNPGPLLKSELGEAASTLHDLVQDLKSENQQILGARLFGSEGLLLGGSVETLLETLARVRDENRCPDEPNTVTGLDRAVVIALMGDIGALYVDGLEKSVVEGRTLHQSNALIENLHGLMVERKLSTPTENNIRNIQKVAGSSSVGPLKKEERYRPPAELSLRTGIHNTGEKADIQLGIAPNQRIPGAKWDIAHLSKDRVVATTEPLVGHMSGSPAEILQVWDMLRGDSHEMQFLGALNKREGDHWDPLSTVSLERQDQQLARVAGAAAFLVGLGYHSAVEVAEGTLSYMGQNLRAVLGNPKDDAGHLLGHGAATSLMSELFKEQSVVSRFSEWV
ncbi:hypothetical protein [Pseudomonas sp. Irchel s3b2]|uniref:hypothetical protein n=1 Tax=Pseudomonas sp. Irchel s3b2 TaxID=2009073 RepID=UPI001C43DD66|nr:hypothetical protein [Pseudomonas sp. Irchel s3b2]